jgi:hypothetical protein
VKLDMESPAAVQDLSEDEVWRFFDRRASKLICRDLAPLVLMDRTGRLERTLKAALGWVADDLEDLRLRYGREETIFGEGLERLVGTLERRSDTLRLTAAVAGMMFAVYQATVPSRARVWNETARQTQRGPLPHGPVIANVIPGV